MTKYPGGWLDLAISNPIPIANVIAYASIGATAGSVKYSTNFNVPTGSWVTSTPPPLPGISGNPTVVAVNAVTNPDDGMIASSINAQTQMANTTAAPVLQNLVYLYGNPAGDLRFEMNIPIALPPGKSFSSIQISLLENAATNGIDQSGKIPVLDFGTGPFTGNITLSLMLAGYFGEVHIGIRFYNSTDNTTFIYDLRAIILPTISNNVSENNKLLYNSSDDLKLTQINGGDSQTDGSPNVFLAAFPCDKTIVKKKPRPEPCIYFPPPPMCDWHKWGFGPGCDNLYGH